MRPLQGIRVLDLTRLLPGPFASLVLADMGAQVDKLEEPEGGDYLRAMPPAPLFGMLNRDKRSIALDLKKPEGVQAFKKLLAEYDVLFEQFRPGVLARLGLAPADLKRDFPRLVVCSLTGYGQDGPLSQRAGHDLNYLARAGALHPFGPTEGPPTIPGVQIGDIGGALWCVIGILGALAQRAKTGEGSHVDISMHEACVGFAAVAYATAAAGKARKPGDDILTGALAGYGTYATKDGRAMSLGALEPKFILPFLQAVGLPADGKNVIPGPHQTELKAELAKIFASKTQAEWIAFAEQGDYCLEPVMTPEEAVNDPHLQSRGWKSLAELRFPITPRNIEHQPAPKLGEHTEMLLGLVE